MDNKTLVVGACALAVGILLGMLFSSSGPSLEEIRAAVGDEVATASEKSAALEQKVSGMAEQVTALSSGLGGIETSVKDLSAKMGQDAEGGSDDVKALSARLEDMASSLTAKLSETAQSQATALKQGLADLSAKRSEGTSAPAKAETQAAKPAQTAASAGEPKGITPGMTESFADGAVRVTLSRVDDTAGVARLSVNGQTVKLGAGDTMMAGDCKVKVDSVDRGHAAVSALCGSDLPAPSGLAPGETAMLGDGAAKVFVSAVSDKAKTARIAVNGFSLETVPSGGTAAVAGTNCKVSVDQIDRGRVSLGYACGG
ncbi:MAG: hypothetical protein KDA73_06810 [Rhodobacteraceae bacterium]|nr:hypothetical protein [Paracoccaceae bacterium]